jgi:predicted Zn finger-like uncharacterized protein
MIVTCSACQTQYVLPENAIGPKGRTVKCAHCGYNWRQPPITVTEIDLSPPQPADNPVTETSQDHADTPTEPTAAELAHKLRWQSAIHAQTDAVPVSHKSRIFKLAVLWFLLLTAITLITLAYMRPKLVRAWPASALLYETLGFPAPAAGAGIKFGDETSASFDPQAMPSRLHVTGQFSNTESHAVRLPILQARLFDHKGQWLKDWSIPLGRVTYMAGKQNLAFDYTLPQVPLEAYSLTFRFTDE